MMIARLKRVLMSMRLFSKVMVAVPLRGYQVAAAEAVVESCVYNRGLEFLWVFPRQSGKDEAVGQAVAFLLTLFRRTEAGIVHVYPTMQQTATGVQRLERRLSNGWLDGQWWSRTRPVRVGVGKAQCAFFSGHPLARAEGATANLLLVVNEVQDCEESIIERRFTPMRASTNASALYVGTVRTRRDYLWRVKERLERLERADGVRRVFMVSADEVGAENPAYAAFVAGQVAGKGRHHPVVMTELFNEPVDVATGLFPERRRALMHGRHARLRVPSAGEIYVALIDVGGQDEAATSAFATLDNPQRDYTVCSVVRVVPEPGGVGPQYEVVDVLADQGSRHFQDVPGQPSLFKRLMAYLRIWEPVAVVCDASGVGQGIADALVTGYAGLVFGFDFAKGFGKARLGNDLLSIVETGRLRYFKESLPDVGSDEWYFFLQCEYCGYELAEGVPIERGLRWGVPESAKVQLPNGDMLWVHDDRLLSVALIAEVDRLYRVGELFLGTGESAVIPMDVGDSIDRSAW